MGLAAMVAGFIFVLENYEAFKERLSDWDWWRNSLITAAKQMVLIFGGPLSKALGITDAVMSMKSDSKEYVTEFGSFADAIKKQAKDLAKAMGFLSNPFKLGSPSPKGTTSKETPHQKFKNSPF